MKLQSRSYTTPGTYTWTPPSGVTAAIICAIGAGAGGAGVQTYGGSGNAGGGGGAAEFCGAKFVHVSGTLTVVVGDKGAGAVYPGGISQPTGPGTAGGNSSAGNSLIALGGTATGENSGGPGGGSGGGPNGGVHGFGAGGSLPGSGSLDSCRAVGGNGGGGGSNGATNQSVSPIAWGNPSTSINNTGNESGGSGADSPYGPGGENGGDATSINGFSAPTTSYGAGGGGGRGNSQSSGGDGAGGRVDVFWVS